MYLKHLRDSLIRFINGSKRKDEDDQSNCTPLVCEQNPLINRLNCIALNKEEVEYLQACLTTILEARHQDQSLNSSSITHSSGIVVEMTKEELREFSRQVKGDSLCLFRAIVKSDNNPTQPRKLAIIGENGMHLFHVLVRSRNSSLHKC
jgi:hypothetical protein